MITEALRGFWESLASQCDTPVILLPVDRIQRRRDDQVARSEALEASILATRSTSSKSPF